MASKNSEVRENKFPRIYYILIGIVLIIIALIIPASTFAPVFKAEINYQLNKDKQVTEITPVNTDFSIVIPKINANTSVIKDVDSFDSKIYQQALTKGVAHAKNTALPGQSGNIFIFAHSAGNWYQANQFNAVFYLLNKLNGGDKIIIYYQNQKYNYTVQETKLINANDISYMSSNSDQNQLTLMTCWPPGTTLKRLIVITTLQK